MRTLMACVAALGAVPIVMIAAIETAAPALADTAGVSLTCFPQSVNPHPTDRAGQTSNTLFCRSTNPNGTWSASGKPAAWNRMGLFGGLIGFLSTAGGLAFLFGLLVLMLIVLVAFAVTAALRRGHGKDWAS